MVVSALSGREISAITRALAGRPKAQPAIARGAALLEDPAPALNKGTAFTLEEGAALALDGLLPPVVTRRFLATLTSRRMIASSAAIYCPATLSDSGGLLSCSRCSRSWLPWTQEG